MRIHPNLQNPWSSVGSIGWLVLVAGCALLARPTRTAAADAAADINAVGVYRLIAVDGAEVPATVTHGPAELRVQSGTFTIAEDGTCISRIRFGRVGSSSSVREVKATYTLEGSQLTMRWQGAGTTTGTVEADLFKMNNEGMVFTYRRQQSGTAGQEFLERLLGTWHTDYTLTNADGARGPMRGSADFTCSRVLGGQFVQDATTHADGRTHLAMYTYDKDRACYRGWWFHSTGEVAESSGQWDPETETLTWTAVQAEDGRVSITAKWKFNGDKKFTWTVEGTSPEGTELFGVQGNAIRAADSGATPEPLPGEGAPQQPG